MKLHYAPDFNQNRFTGYGSGHVQVNSVDYHHSLLVFPDRIVDVRDAPDFESLAKTHFDSILAFRPEIVLLGTGERQRFCHPALYQSLTMNQIGVEIMDNAAACRTYNILMEEGRQVAALLIIG